MVAQGAACGTAFTGQNTLLFITLKLLNSLLFPTQSYVENYLSLYQAPRFLFLLSLLPLPSFRSRVSLHQKRALVSFFFPPFFCGTQLVGRIVFPSKPTHPSDGCGVTFLPLSLMIYYCWADAADAISLFFFRVAVSVCCMRGGN